MYDNDSFRCPKIVVIMVVGIMLAGIGLAVFAEFNSDVKCIYNANIEISSSCNIQTDNTLAVFYVEGQSLSNVKVQVNGVNILVPKVNNGKLLFSTDLRLGSNEIVITAYNGMGNQLKEFVFSVLVKN